MTRRILLTTVGVTVLAIAALFVPAARAIRSAQERGELLELQREASVVAARVPATGPIDESVLDPVVDDQHRLGLYGPDGSLLGGAGPETADRIVRAALAGNFAEGRVDEDLVAAVPVRALVDGSSLAVRIEAPRSIARSRFIRSMLELGAAALLIVALAAALAAALARRLNRPIDELRRWAARPPGTDDPPDPTGIVELDALRDELLADRARIEELLQRERSFSSQVSHQLRTPVAAMRVAIETERDAPRDDRTIVLDEAVGQLDRLETTISGLLALARHDDRPNEPVHLDELARSIATTHHRRLGPETDRSIVVRGPAATIETDRVAIEHIVDVLVDNAIRHGTGTVVIEVGEDDDGARIDVGDEGSRPTDRDVFTEQADDGRHGIGLRLARTLAESIGGSLTLLDVPTTTFRLDVRSGHRERAHWDPPTTTPR